eukprot:TRINITY_DN5054_c0_g1_i1.p1 TRINITY_DN5054_c0_g1~~TRINITY_DN5054_c0_g1_i1.p1  ORF type:complete len:329 (-),score=38.86 TRINITY_DN5054_c0_g1_i1:100-1086(-)
MVKASTNLLGITALVLVFIALVVFTPTVAAAGRIVGYWGATPGGHKSTLPQLQTAVKRGYNTIIYAFYDVDANGGLHQDPGSATAPQKESISSSRFTYLVSLFGGQNGAAPTLSISPDSWAQNMFNNFQALRRTYGFDGIDIDLENAWGGTPNQVICGLRKFFKLMHNAGYTVSMAPQTTALTPQVSSYEAGSWNSYAPLTDTSIINYVDIVAVQLYNNAVPFNSPDAYAKSLTSGFQVSGTPNCAGDSGTGLVRVPANKIAFGFPAGPGAAPSGCPGLPGGCPYGSALSNMYRGSGTLKGTGGVMTWSVEWDEANNWQFVNAANAIF